MVVATKTYQLPDRKIDWEVRLNLSSTINAMSLPNGKIVLNSAIAWNDLTDDELAFLISHEMSHVLREHARERKSIKYVSNSALLFVATGLGQIPAFFTVYGGQLASSVPTSRIMETEANLISLDLMARAGYKPQATISFWDKTEARIKSVISKHQNVLIFYRATQILQIVKKLYKPIWYLLNNSIYLRLNIKNLLINM